MAGLHLLTSARRFMARPLPDKTFLLLYQLRRVFPNIPVPMRLSSGVWWILWNDVMSRFVLRGVFEPREKRFVERYLRPQMTVLDIGAHNGFYALLASRRIGPAGSVIAFEPSPRERRRLRWNVRLNRLKNIRVEPLALGNAPGHADLFVVRGSQTGFNSLRPPSIDQPIAQIPVRQTTLDDYLRARPIGAVDFMKIDVEGGEREVIRGATGFLSRRPRPVIMCEIEDVRTAAWGYNATEIVTLLRALGFAWFAVRDDGTLVECPEPVDGNFVAIPEERLHEVASCT
jgi:FkbM family methyltransferase